MKAAWQRHCRAGFNGTVKENTQNFTPFWMIKNEWPRSTAVTSAVLGCPGVAQLIISRVQRHFKSHNNLYICGKTAQPVSSLVAIFSPAVIVTQKNTRQCDIGMISSRRRQKKEVRETSRRQMSSKVKTDECLNGVSVPGHAGDEDYFKQGRDK